MRSTALHRAKRHRAVFTDLSNTKYCGHYRNGSPFFAHESDSLCRGAIYWPGRSIRWPMGVFVDLAQDPREEQERVLARLRVHAGYLARRYSLPLRSIEAERPNVKRRYGICYRDGRIRIRLRHARTGRLLKYSFLVDTLCHELAHLRYFHHGPTFRRFYEQILRHARRTGIYLPGPGENRAFSGVSRQISDMPRPVGTRVPAAPTHTGAAKKKRLPSEPRQLELFPGTRPGTSA